jgi:hypothetical protein
MWLMFLIAIADFKPPEETKFGSEGNTHVRHTFGRVLLGLVSKGEHIRAFVELVKSCES